MVLLKESLEKIRSVHACWKYPGRTTSVTYKKYPKDYTFKGMRVLNLGCGNTTYPAANVVNLDMFPVPGVNVTWDLSKTPLPFKDNEFDLIVANHILEHVRGWWECFKELARIVKVGGTIEVWGPGYGESQLGYRDHINVINHCSFAGIIGTHRNGANAWEIEDRKNLGEIQNLRITFHYKMLERRWWLEILPYSLKSWVSDYLPNVVTEVGFKFVKEQPINLVDGSI
jgi:SAM-dependent methyltransferase